MSRSLGHVIGDSLNLGLSYAERLLAGITADRFARLAAPGGAVIQSNHPAFVYGHLSLYAPRIVAQLGGDVAAVSPSERFLELFSKEAECRDDATGTQYPPMDEITSAFFNNYRAANEMLRQASDETLAQPNEGGGRMAELFPTMGSTFAFYSGGHLMFHLGQVSAWRRMMGLARA